MSLSSLAEKIKPTLAFVLAWAFLNVLMNIKYPAKQMHMLTLFKVSPEISGIIMIPLAAACMGLPFHPGFYLPLTAFVIFLRLFRIGDILVPMYFFRPFNLFLDAQFVPDLIHLLYITFSLKTFIPVHVISRNNELLEPFRKRGYSPGLIPNQPPPHRGMETFLYDFLADFSTPE